MKKLHNTDIPKFYTFVDNNNKFVKDFDDVEELIKYAKSYTYRNYNCDFKDLILASKKWVLIEVNCRIGYSTFNSYFWRKAKLKNMYVTDARGDFVDVFEIEKATRRPFRGYWYPNKHREISHKKADALHERNIIRGKNVNKIKAAYSIKERVTSSGDIYYDHHMLGYWRYIRTYGIHRDVAGVEHEEGEPKFRGKRSRKAIPTVWDDRSNGVYSNEKSWKHNSKRRKQWKPKPHLIEVGS